MSHMEAQGLHNAAGLFLQLSCHGAEGIGGEQLPGILQSGYLVIALPDFLCGNLGVLVLKLGNNFLPAGAFVQGNYIVSHLVHHMDSAGADVQDDIHAPQFILMYHMFFLS